MLVAFKSQINNPNNFQQISDFKVLNEKRLMEK
jgi:hypothetical protein